jgi:hypothetical protein
MASVVPPPPRCRRRAARGFRLIAARGAHDYPAAGFGKTTSSSRRRIVQRRADQPLPVDGSHVWRRGDGVNTVVANGSGHNIEAIPAVSDTAAV